MSARYFALFSMMVVGLLMISLFAIGVGPLWIKPLEVAKVIGYHMGMDFVIDETHDAVVWAIRFPRVLLGIIVGASLAQSGTALQGLFRNPLADPGLIGVSNGAALGAVAMIVLQDSWEWSAKLGIYAIPVAAFITGLAVMFTVYHISYSRRKTDVATLLLTGIAVSFLCMAVMGIMVFMASEDELRSLTFWQMGSLGRVGWKETLMLIPTFLLANFVIVNLAKPLNLFLLGEDEAEYLGLSVEMVKRLIIVLTSFLVAGAVAFSGVIGFVGLVVPHILRLSLGPDHRGILFGSALLGAILLLLADIIARTIVAPAELPIGIVTTLLGVPFFLYLLIQQKRKTDGSL